MGHPVDFLYSLYDALVSINVPNDRARAVVDAMERDMVTSLATRQDMALLASRHDLGQLQQDVLLLRRDLESYRQDVRQDLQSLRKDLESATQGAHKDRESTTLTLRQEIEATRSSLGHDIALLRSDMERRFAQAELRMTVRLAVLLAGYTGLLFGMLRLMAV